MGAEGELIDGKVLYHEFEKEDESARILIFYEPVYPEHFHMDDAWVDLLGGSFGC